MACDDYGNITEPLKQFNGSSPLDSVICPYAADFGGNMGMTVFTLFVFTALGLGLTIRAKHPGPVVVVAILAAGIITPTLPGVAAKILALVLFFAIAGVSLVIYQRMQSSL